MSGRLKWILVVAAMSVPAGLWAQHQVAFAAPAISADQPAPPPGVDNPAPDDGDDMSAEVLAVLGFDDEMMALADGGDGGDDHGAMAEGMHGPGGPHPGMGMGMHPGMGMGMGRMGHGGPMMRARLAALGLSDDQKTRLQALHEAEARKAIQRRADMQLAQLDLQKMMREDKPNVAAVNAQIDKLTRLHADGMKARFAMQMQARTILTPDQVKKLHDGMGGMPGMNHEMGDFEHAPHC